MRIATLVALSAFVIGCASRPCRIDLNEARRYPSIVSATALRSGELYRVRGAYKGGFEVSTLSVVGDDAPLRPPTSPTLEVCLRFDDETSCWETLEKLGKASGSSSDKYKVFALLDAVARYDGKGSPGDECLETMTVVRVVSVAAIE